MNRRFPWSRCLFLAPLVLLAGCVISSENPLSDPDKAKLDEALIGKWLQKDTSFTIEKMAAADYPPGLMKVTATPLKGNNPPQILLVFATELKGKTYLNIFGLKDKEKIEDPANIPAWKVVRSKGFHIVKYAAEKDRVLIWTADQQEPLMAAIKNGKLKGKVQNSKAGSWAEVTDSSANLAELVAREDARIFTGQPTVYTRAK